MLETITAEALASDGIFHGFFTRKGGASKGIFQGLNVGLGSGDDRDTVLDNRALVARQARVPAENLLTAYQVHSNRALVVQVPFDAASRPQVDALVTSKPGIAIGALTADCGPVLFSDPQNRVIACAHAGWKGAVGGVLEETVATMEKEGAERGSIRAVLGPTISQQNYEVGPEFVTRLCGIEPDGDRWFIPAKRDDHALFDLPGYIVHRLRNAGVEVHWTGHCTYADEARFFSYRRKTHRGEDDYGRQISVISLTPQGA